MSQNENSSKRRYLSTAGAWALAFGCSVGWGAFVMPGTTFLPIAGPIGTAVGIGIGGLVMLVLAANYHFLMNVYPDSGGAYSYTKNIFGYDHGFLSAWFLIITYIAIIWANASALPLIARTLFGGLFQFGFHYVIAGFHVYCGEILLAVSSLLIAAILCLHKKLAGWVQTIMAFILFFGILICFGAALSHAGTMDVFMPHYAPANSPTSGIFTIFALAPWAYVGFESISHSADETTFDLKKTFGILVFAIIAAFLAYSLLTMLAVTALPQGCENWVDYINNLGSYEGYASQPTFFAAFTALGIPGTALLGIVTLCAIYTGLIGNYIALSRLLYSLSKDGMMPELFSVRDKNDVPRNAILAILAISVFLPFFGRTAISWIVDVTTVGATIAYAFCSAAAWKHGRDIGNRRAKTTGMAGLVISVLFALDFLIPNVTSVKTLSTESYLILAVWSIVGFLFFRQILKNDTEHHYGRSVVAWVVLLGLIVFTSSVWMRQSTEQALEQSAEPIQEYCLDKLEEAGIDGSEQPSFEYLPDILNKVNRTIQTSTLIQTGLIIAALWVLFDIYSMIQKREKQIEVEKALAEESSRAKTSFLSNMSHEIRTPMNAIIGLDNIALRDPDLTPKTREHLEKIGSSAKHLLGLINDILDMSRIESGRMSLKNEEFPFHEFLDQINIMINGQCMDKGLQYDCSIIGQVSDYYYGDDMKLKQVLINILGNSVKFTDPPGQVRLTVEQINEFEGLCTLRFTMKDTGIGMDKDFIPKIFEAFSQENETATNMYGGSGLGMAITKNFVEMMNGEIQVESEKGVGSTFTVTVTLKNSPRNIRDEHALNLPKDTRAFVVDDDEIALEHAMVVLRSLGIEADGCTAAKEAVETVKKAYESGRPYHLFLPDYKMPGMNGLEASKAIREFDHGDTAVIMLTGYSWDTLEDEGMMDCVDGIVAKPLYSDTLLREIHAVLAKKEGIDLSVNRAENIDTSVLTGKRILMAEDVQQNAEILEDLLMLEDMEAEHAVNGEEAVKMFSEHEPGYYDAILMDVRMPVMDGLTAAKTIRALGREDAKQIPIIAMTANVFDEDVERSLQAGMNAHLSKPVEADLLYTTLAKIIPAAGSSKSSEHPHEQEA